MQPNVLKNMAAKVPWLVVYPLTREDSVAMTALRSMVADVKGKLEGTAGRGPFVGIMERGTAPEGVTFRVDAVGGYPVDSFALISRGETGLANFVSQRWPAALCVERL